jgi:hypothetical protein
LLRDILGRRKLFAFALLGPILFIPQLVGIVQGQTSTLTLFLLALVYASLRDGKNARAGCLLGMACIKPQFVLPLLLAAIAVGMWRVVASFLSMGSVLTVLSAALVGWRATLSYPAAWVRFNVLPREMGGAHVEGMPNVRGILYVLLQGHVSTIVLVCVTLLATVILLALVVATVRAKALVSELVFAFIITTTLLASYYCYLFDLSMLLLAFVLLLSYLRRRDLTPIRFAIVLTILLLYVLPFFSPTLERMIVNLFFATLALSFELRWEISAGSRRQIVVPVAPAFGVAPHQQSEPTRDALEIRARPSWD